ncbi:hypothetical protein F5B20DRAFT_520632 [Whalleya microplaca]|nr:hypothetical protein F5B20DRAFT_520632 [Whalleya microplaca]
MYLLLCALTCVTYIEACLGNVVTTFTFCFHLQYIYINSNGSVVHRWLHCISCVLFTGYIIILYTPSI